MVVCVGVYHASLLEKLCGCVFCGPCIYSLILPLLHNVAPGLLLLISLIFVDCCKSALINVWYIFNDIAMVTWCNLE